MFFGDFLERIQELTNKLGEASPIRFVIGCSGGADSRVLLDLMTRLPTDRYAVAAILHINHNLRATSNRDAHFVENLARSYNLPYALLDVCPYNVSGTKEEWGRKVRYSFFEEQRIKFKADLIVTAHHLDDEIETFLFRLITGRNNYELSLIRSLDLERRLLRPFLTYKKEDIISYARLHELKYFEDETNSENFAARNIIRNEILPQFDKLNSQYRNHIAHFLHTLRVEKSYIFGTAHEFKGETLSQILTLPECVILRIFNLLAIDTLPDKHHLIPLKKYSELLQYVQRSPQGLTFFEMGGDIKAAVDFRSSGAQLRFFTQEDLEVENRNYQLHKSFDLSIHPGEERTFINQASSKKCLFGVTLHEPRAEIMRVSELHDVKKESILVEYFEVPQSTRLKFHIRGSCYFERIPARNAKGGIRVSKLIKNAKISNFEKKSLVYVSSEDTLLWIPSIEKAFMHKKPDNIYDEVPLYMYYAEIR